MKKTLTILSIALCWMSIAAPVRSMVAARNVLSSESAEQWVNPYVTDGLIAMWDGEWNVGPGKHDQDSMSWIDLVGNKILTWTDANAYFNSNCLLLLNGNKSEGKTLCYLDIPLSNYSNTTFECVLKFDWRFSDNYNNIQMPIAYNPVTLPYSVHQKYGIFTQYSNIMYAYPDSPLNDSTIASCSTSESITNAPAHAYLNGQYHIFNTLRKYTLTARRNGRFYLLRCPRTDVQLYTMRIYDRVLTDDEVMQNYLVDKERFNLP